MLHFRGGRAGISREAYPDLEPFYDDVADAYGDELRCAGRGRLHLRADGRHQPRLPVRRRRCAKPRAPRGDDPDELPHRYAGFINRVVAQQARRHDAGRAPVPRQLQEHLGGQGGYEPVAEALLSEMDVDAYFLEYDDARSGDFRPLRFLPKGKTVVLGLVTTKLGAAREARTTSSGASTKPRKYVPLEQLALSPAVRLLEHRARQRHRGRGAARQAAAGGRGRARSLGLSGDEGQCLRTGPRLTQARRPARRRAEAGHDQSGGLAVSAEGPGQ